MTGLELFGLIGVTCLAIAAVKWVFVGSGVGPNWSNGGLPR